MAGPFSNRYWHWCLAGVLLLALWLRWPLPAPSWSHFDEESMVLLPLGFWSGDLNPHFFNYPTLQFYLVSLSYYIHFLLTHSGPVDEYVGYRFFVDSSDLLAIARGCATVMAAGAVAATAYLGRLVYGAGGGLLAALILALMPLSVRFSHLANTDTPAVLWVALALVWAIRLRQRGALADYLIAGLFVGLAGATKYPAALVAAPVATAALLRTPALKQTGIWSAGATAILTFCVASPYVLLDFSAFWADFTQMGRDHLLAAGDSGWSWLYHIRHTLRFGLGLLGLALLAVALARRPRHWRHEEIILLAGLGSFGAMLALTESVFMRYALPLTPILAVLMVRPLLGLHRHRVVLALALAALLAEPAYASLRTRSLLSGEDTREQAVGWMTRNAPGNRHLVHLPHGCGNVQVLTPRRILIRQTHFLNSYGEDGLAEAYSLLRRQEGLPPLFTEPEPGTIVAVTDSTTESSDAQALLLQYRHPLCEGSELGPQAQQLTEAGRWRETFSPGTIETAVFDRMDWYFLPVGRFGEVEQTGPAIRLGTLPLSAQVEAIEAGTFFQLLLEIRKGDLALLSSDWETAAWAYERALQVQGIAAVLPRDHLCSLNGNAGVAEAQLRRHDRALPLLRAAVALRPDDPGYYNDLAIVCVSVGDVEEAIRAWERLLELEPRHPSAHFNLAKILYNSGRYRLAYEVALKGLELTPDHPMATSVRRFLDSAPQAD